jgi:hypothetical protein
MGDFAAIFRGSRAASFGRRWVTRGVQRLLGAHDFYSSSGAGGWGMWIGRSG